MKLMRFQFLAYILPFAFLLPSCGKTYETPLRDEPFFTEKEIKASKLEPEKSMEYTERGNHVVSTGTTYRPNDGETYDDYKARVSNTVVLQKFEQDNLENSLRDKKSSLMNLRDQLKKLQKQHMDLRVKVLQASPAKKKHTAMNRAQFSRYVVQPTDTLQKIAFRKYSDYSAWLMIYRFNNNRLKNGPNKIEVGDEILLPNINPRIALEMHNKAQ